MSKRPPQLLHETDKLKSRALVSPGTHLVRYEIIRPNGETAEILVDCATGRASVPQNAADVVDLPSRVDIDRQFETVILVAEKAIKSLGGLAVEEVGLEFGIEFGGEMGVPILTKISAKANLKVSLKWKNKPAKP